MPDSHIHQEIPCTDRRDAAAEAASQQQTERDPTMEWIYLRNIDAQWVARRVPRAGDGSKPRLSRGEQLIDGAIEVIGDLFTNW
jgi:hypothetical protein